MLNHVHKRGVMKKVMRTATLVALLIVGSIGFAHGEAWGEARFREEFVQRILTSLLSDEDGLRELLKEMPKGADLHSHLSGAVTTERLIEWGAEDGLCVSTATFTAAPPPCLLGNVPMASGAI